MTTYPLGGSTNTVTNTLSNLSVTGIGTGTAVVTFPLQSNLVYAMTISGTDENGITASVNKSFDTILPALVVEAEDFNFGNGQFVDTPANGGVALYLNDVGSQGVDENKKYNAGDGAKSYYRPSDAVVIQPAAPVNGTAQKYVTAAAAGDTVDVPLEVGYNSLGDWLDYTRTFPGGSYYVWARLATVGAGNALNFYQITSDPTQGNQS